MLKKFFSLVLVVLILNIYCVPVFSADMKTLKMKAEYMTNLNVNKANDGDSVLFMTRKDYTDETGFTIPNGTIFKGHVKSHKESHPFYCRGKAKVVIDEMTLPDGRTYKVKVTAKTVKGPLIANIGKVVGTLPPAIITSAVGGVVMVVEAVTIVGLIFVVPTANGFRKGVGRMTKGINCKKHTGSKITLKLKDMQEYRVDEETFIERKKYNEIEK